MKLKGFLMTIAIVVVALAGFVGFVKAEGLSVASFQTYDIKTNYLTVYSGYTAATPICWQGIARVDKMDLASTSFYNGQCTKD